jgi:hypothetical protein
VGTDPNEIIATVHALERMPYQPLGLQEVMRCEAVFEKARPILEMARRIAAQGGPVLDVKRLDSLVADQRARVQDALNRPVSVTSSLAILEERWFSANPGKVLDTTPMLLLLLVPTDEYSSEDWTFRSTCTTFLIREGVVENSPRGTRYRLLAAPAWYTAFAPLTAHTQDMLGAGAPNVTRMVVPVDDLDAGQLETLLGLWTPDALSDLLDLGRVREAVLALTRLEQSEVVSALPASEVVRPVTSN